MKFIPLTKGYEAMVDDEDYDQLTKYKWQVLVCRGRPYARRHGPGDSSIFMHKAVLGIPDKIDHIDNNSLNNQKSNLRAATPTQNGQNRKIQVHSTPYKGVSYFKHQKKFVATIKALGKRVHLGYFEDPVNAAKAYDAAAIRFFGEFARTNQQLGAL